jgi:hypothetical protein
LEDFPTLPPEPVDASSTAPSESERQPRATVPPREPPDLPSLQRRQAEAVRDLDFVSARSFQEQIDGIESKDSVDQVSQHKELFESTLTSIGQSYLRNRRRRIAALLATELELRTEMDTNFEKARARHVTELGELQARLIVECRTEVAKSIAGYDTLVRQARANAARGDFERAQTHQERADALRAAANARRGEQYERNYKAAVGSCLRRQTAEMAAIAARGRVAIGTFEVDRNRQLDELIAKFRRDLARAYKTAVADFSSPAKRKVVDRRIVVESLNALEDAYSATLVKFRLQDGSKEKFIRPGGRGESRMSLRMQSRVETRVDEWKSSSKNVPPPRPPPAKRQSVAGTTSRAGT